MNPFTFKQVKQVSEPIYIQAGQWVCLHSSKSLNLFTLKQVSDSVCTQAMCVTSAHEDITMTRASAK
jgi:hypothetical protein